MANSSVVANGDLATADQYNDLREDVLDTSTGHLHNGTDGRQHATLPVTNLVYVNESANANMTQGITINQGAADNQALTLKSSDVAHALVSGGLVAAEADDYFFVQKVAAAEGGARLVSVAENPAGVEMAMRITAMGGQASTTPAVGALSLIYVEGYEHDGANALIDNPANSLIFGIGRRVAGVNSRMAFAVDAEGDIHVDGSATVGTFDDYPDHELVRAGHLGLLGEELSARLREYADVLEELGVIHWNRDTDGVPFINLKRGLMLAWDGLAQQGAKIAQLEEAQRELRELIGRALPWPE